MFSWDASKALKNYRAHGVPFDEAATVFSDPDALDWDDLEHSEEEHRSQRIGFSIEGHVLFVVYTLRRLKDGRETIRIISARQASSKEREAYAG
jgi:uncharacterized DUF497 family protein